ncbi:hypothetical protein CYMTET_4914 [Cymbomonas tetramitiformis]|uniref:Uncharacterized protein n=1 Tax=Cymbomonas tetramitiformis TaxID=36881 RepID=A0AAE0H0G5_9CHLO|nr:hypothetical protein CYMTET_4914 [Cymbomonas tetramitiformis]
MKPHERAVRNAIRNVTDEYCFEAWELLEESEEEEEEEEAAEAASKGPDKGKGKGRAPEVDAPPKKSPRKANAVASPSKGKANAVASPSKGKATAQEEEDAADQSDLAKRYPVGKEVYLYARPTDSDEALIESEILDPKDYFTSSPPLTLKKTVPLLSGTISACELHAETVHGPGKSDIKLPPEFLSIKVKQFNSKKTGADEWHQKAWKVLKHILSSTDKHVSEEEAKTKTLSKVTEKCYEDLLRGKKLPKELNLVVHGKYVRYGLLQHAFAGPPKGGNDTE